MRKRLFAIICALFLMMGCSACSAGIYDYDYEKSSDNMLQFESSDKELDHFLNDFLHRHLRYDDYSIGPGKLGESVVFNKEYEALSLLWFDTTENALGPGDNRFDLVMQSIDQIPVDDYGYAWCAFNHLESPTMTAGSLFAQGWPFPNYSNSEGRSFGFEFNTDEEDWTTNVTKTKSANGLFSLTAYNADTIDLVSPDLLIDRRGNPIDTFHAPYIHMDLRMTDRVGIGANTTIEDIYIYYRQKGQADFSESQKVSYLDFATISNPIQGNFAEKIYFPMYTLPDWQNIDKIKISIRPKENKKLSVNVDLNYFRLDYDSRKGENNALMLNAAKTMLEFTGDQDMLRRNLNRFRKMTLFMLEALEGKNGLLDMGYFVGHEGIGGQVGYSIGGGYFDIFAAPETSFYGNVYFLEAIESMAYMEKVAEETGIGDSVPATTIRAPYAQNSEERIKYTWTSDALYDLADRIKECMQRDIKDPVLNTESGKYEHNPDGGFWDPENGRFIEGFNTLGEKIDYGFVVYNLEAIARDIPTQEQSEKIMAWIDGERIIQGDLVQGKFGSEYVGPDNPRTYGIYDLEFAPRTTTIKNDKQYYWGWNGSMVAYGEQVQDGGAIMFTSYYDLLARIRVLGADNAFRRLKEIQAWYNKVEEAAARAGVGVTVSNQEFYRAYYRELGIQMQGGGTAGGIGLDFEFLESALLYAAVPMGFFGISSTGLGCLQIEPQIPSSLDFWKMENLRYMNVDYDLTVGQNFVQIDSVRGNTASKKIEIVLSCGNGQKVYVDGQEVQFKADGAKARVEVPFYACKIEVR